MHIDSTSMNVHKQENKLEIDCHITVNSLLLICALLKFKIDVISTLMNPSLQLHLRLTPTPKTTTSRWCPSLTPSVLSSRSCP
jgi:hypothetical protein